MYNFYPQAREYSVPISLLSHFRVLLKDSRSRVPKRWERNNAGIEERKPSSAYTCSSVLLHIMAVL